MQKHDKAPESPAGNVQTAGQSVRRVRSDEGKIRSSQPAFEAIRAAEFASATYRADYIVDHLLVEGQPMVIGGPKKSLKTSLALALALSVAAGRRFLGHFPVRETRRVLFCSGENALSELQGTARRICRAAPIELGRLNGFTVCPTLPHLGDMASVHAFGQLIAQLKAQLVILDPAYLMMPGADVANVFKQGELLRRISDVCREWGATLIICHHLRTRRSDDLAPADLDDLAYAGFAEFARQWLLVSRREPYDEHRCGVHHLWLRAGGSAGHNSLWAADMNEGSIDDPGGRRWDVQLRRAVE